MSIDRRKVWGQVAVIPLVLFFAGTLFASESFVGRVMPKGKVLLYRGAQKVGELTSEAPLPEGTRVVCEDRCAVRTPELFMVGENQSAFSLSRARGDQELTVEKGTLFFALSALPAPLVFHTPQAAVTADAIVLNASAGPSLLKGYVSVMDKTTAIGVLEGGSMIVTTPQGQRTIAPGEQILLAMAELGGGGDEPDSGVGGGVGAGAGIAMGFGGFMTSYSLFGVADSIFGDDGAPASPFVPPPGS